MLDKPAHFGTAVEAVPDVGYKVEILVAAAGGSGDWNVDYFHYIITHDGRVNAFQSARQIDIPGEGHPILRDVPAGSIDKAVRAALAATGVEKVPRLFEVTDQQVTIPCQADKSANDYISDFTKWSPETSK